MTREDALVREALGRRRDVLILSLGDIKRIPIVTATNKLRIVTLSLKAVLELRLTIPSNRILEVASPQNPSFSPVSAWSAKVAQQWKSKWASPEI